MASRRTRIKGIANIPQRRKAVVGQEKSSENDNLTNENDKVVKKLDVDLTSDIQQECTEVKGVSKDVPVVENSSLNATDTEKINKEIDIEPTDNTASINSETPGEKIQFSGQVKETGTETANVPQTLDPPKPALKRRTFIKPLVSVNVINRRPKQNIEQVHQEPVSKDNSSKSLESDPVSNDRELKQPVQQEVSNVGHEATLDEVNLMPQNGKTDTDLTLDKGIKKFVPQTGNAQNSDSEYPPPPPSPSKINRSRIKAVPRLGYRKTSFSASESEDESKRIYNRNRNDSMCSTASGIPESIADCMSPQRLKDCNSMVQKKCNRTEQSRKLAEARREFQRRFGTNKPDRQSLTMMDLIFYNPTSNPMTSEEKSKAEDGVVQEMEANEREADSEKVDDPQAKPEEPEKSDNENEMPVPQIKIGPSGEIILDEKSLVVENKEVKKQREELQKKRVVDGDFDTGYGIYKRQKRAKEWTHGETLRFYKALNTIGTDFSLMCELFPRRTRRELKQKFKKEEKINRSLVDKAVMQPCNFDYAILKHEVDMEEREMEELKKQKEAEHKLRQERLEKRQMRKRKAMEKAQVEEKPETPPPPKIRKIRKPRQKKFNIESILDDSDADVSDIATQSESEPEDEEIVLKPTRSGRIPKVTKKFDVSGEATIDSIMKKNRLADTNVDDIAPGSIMINTEQGPQGDPVYKIYMVTADKNAAPLELNSEIVSKTIQFKKGVTAKNILTISTSVIGNGGEGDTPLAPEENNVTIPADESVTTLRSDNGTEDSGFRGKNGAIPCNSNGEMRV